MAIKVACPACARKLKARDRHAGWRAKCPACGVAVEVPSPVASTPNGQAPHGPRRPAAARGVVGAGPRSDDGEAEYIAPPFRPTVTGADAVGRHVPRPPRVGRGRPRDSWLLRFSQCLGLASLGVGGAILFIGLPTNQVRGGGVLGAAWVVGCALAAFVAGAGLLLLVDVARSLRRLCRGADRGAGVK